MSNNLVKKATDYVSAMLRERLPEKFVYHDFTHTLDVFDTCKKLGEDHKLSPWDMEILLLAAIFHDTGYTVTIEGHEEESAEIAESFLKENGCPDDKIQKVKSSILATRMPQNPGNLMEEIICDADLSHFGKKEFFERIELLRIELEYTKNLSFSDFEWLKSNIEMLISHPFRTKAALAQFEERRMENLLKLQKKLRKKTDNLASKESKLEIQKEKIAFQKDKQSRPERGIETMFRITATNHIRLSDMADNKANIMLSINTILISIVLTVLARKLDVNPHLIIPTFILLLVSLMTIVFATIVTRPKVTAGLFTKQDIQEKKANLLFFGNFYNMDYNDFEWGMKEMMNDKEYLYGSMIKDFYFLGKVLGNKYKYLSICYNTFTYGMILSIIAFAIAILLHPGVTNIN